MAELGSSEITVHKVEGANQCGIVRSCGHDVGLADAEQRTAPVRPAELLGLSQARRDRRRSDRIDGARKGIQDADLEPFPPLGSEVVVRHPRGEFRDPFGLALAADDRRWLFCTMALAGGLTFRLLSQRNHFGNEGRCRASHSLQEFSTTWLHLTAP